MTEAPRSGWHVSPQVVFGLAIVCFGLLLTAGNLGIAPHITRVIQFWPMVFTAAGLAMVLDRDSSGSRRTFGALLVIAGLWQTANSAFGLNFYIDDYWPMLLVLLGAFLIMRAVQRTSARSPESSAPGTFGAPAATSSQDGRDEVVSAFALMSGVKRNVFSPAFRRANLTAIMGGVELDLRESTAAGGESVIDVFALWGGIVIRVPADWQVASEVVPLMGGVDDRSGHVQPSRHRVVIKGLAMMGGVEVKS